MFSKLSNYLTSKTFWLIDILFIVCMVFLVKSAWGSLDYYSRWAALLLIVGASALLLIGLTWITGNMVLDWKRRSIANQLQTPLPLSSLPTAKISEQTSIAPVPHRQGLPPGNGYGNSHKDKIRNRRNDKTRNGSNSRNGSIPVPGNSSAPGNIPVSVPGNTWEQGYRPPSTAIGNAVPVPENTIIYGQPFQVRTKLFGVQEQEHIVSLSKEGTSHRDICKALGIGNAFYPTIAEIIKAYDEQVIQQNR